MLLHLNFSLPTASQSALWDRSKYIQFIECWEPAAEECDIAATLLVEVWPLWILTLRYVSSTVQALTYMSQLQDSY